MRGVALLLTVVVALAGLPPVAHAQEQAEFDAAVQQGLKAYQAKNYDMAIEAFEKAYKIRPEPEMIFNIARSHEKAQHLDAAIAGYERFMVLEGTTSELRARAVNSLRALRAEKSARDKAAGATSTTPGLSAPPPGAAPPGLMTRGEVPAEPPNRALEWSLFGGGMAIAATGAVFAGLALSNKSDFDDEKDNGVAADEQRLQDLRDDLDRNALIADILVPVGLVTAAVGLSLLIVNSPEDDVMIEVAPNVDPNQSGLQISGSF